MTEQDINSDIQSKIDRTIEAISSFQCGEPSWTLQDITNRSLQDDILIDAESLDAVFSFKHSELTERLFTGIISLHTLLTVNNHTLSRLRDVFGQNAKQGLTFTLAIKQSNDLLALCEEQIETIKNDDEDMLVENPTKEERKRENSIIQVQYDTLYKPELDLNFTPNLLNLSQNVKALNSDLFSISDASMNLINLNINLSQLKLGYYNLSDQSNHTPIIPAEDSQIETLTPKEIKEAVCLFTFHDLKSAQSINKNFNTLVASIGNAVDTCFPANAHQFPFGKTLAP